MSTSTDERPGARDSRSLAVEEGLREPLADHLTRLVDRPSVTGAEAEAVDEAERIARDDLALPVRRMPVAAERDNLLVGSTNPRVLLCTHLDTVPPHIPPSRDGDVVYGRGTADAKGIAVAMLHALALLRRQGLDEDVACLLVVGEESDHRGAYAAAESGLQPSHLLLGEPCGLVPVQAQKGVLKLRLKAEGAAGHSAYPELGISATHRLLDALDRLRHVRLPDDELLGATTVNVGELHGGVAANVLAPEAEATLLIRCAAPVDAVVADVRERVGSLVTIEELTRTEPFEFDTLGEEPAAAVPFNTDAHALRPLGASTALLGPGDMRCAHADRERVSIRALEEGVATYARLAARCL